MTKSGLAAAAQLTLRTIVNYESGRIPPPPDRLQALAGILRFPAGFFVRPEVETINAAGVSFRSLARMKASQRDRALAAAEMALELDRWLSERFQLPDVGVPDLSTIRNPEAAAVALRSTWGLGDKPIPHMIRLLEAKGVRVFSLAEAHDALDGYSFWRERTPFVFLNTTKSGERSRFDAAHELAHLVLHRHGSPVGRDIEHEAHAFASAFLMPATSIAAFAPRPPSLDRLIEAKAGWTVSVGALAHRMHDTGMLSDWQYRALCVEIGRRQFRTNEPNPAPREMSLAFEKIFTSLRERGVTKHDVARDLGWPVSELNSLVFGLVLAAAAGNAAEGPGEATSKNGEGTAQQHGRPALSLLP